MLIEMAKNKVIPDAMATLKSEIDKLSINSTKEEAKAIFDAIDDNHVKLINRIDQLRTFFQ